jgi:hypothetical protein
MLSLPGIRRSAEMQFPQQDDESGSGTSLRANGANLA